MGKQHDTGWITAGGCDPHRTITRNGYSYTYVIQDPDGNEYQNVVRIWHDEYNRATEKSGADEVVGCDLSARGDDALYSYVDDAEKKLDQEDAAHDAALAKNKKKLGLAA